jgi:hypothetical protein
MKGEANVQAGICGHNTSVQAETNDGRHVAFTIETTCDNIERFKARLATGGPVDAYKEINPKARCSPVAMRPPSAPTASCPPRL